MHDTGLAVVRVRGADAARFLHVQLTNDVEAMQAGEVVLGAWCTAQGKVRHLFWTVADEDGFDLLCLPMRRVNSVGPPALRAMRNGGGDR